MQIYERLQSSIGKIALAGKKLRPWFRWIWNMEMEKVAMFREFMVDKYQKILLVNKSNENCTHIYKKVQNP